MLAHEITNHKISFVCTRESELAVESIARKDYKIVRQGNEELADTVLRMADGNPRKYVGDNEAQCFKK